ncbi:hypothetical protein O181_006258 [Austropuccinia psidii MF-1]|uniref:Uncharacterized protein n=1 Tax=Austropuccinia psidii MF-1 TaxID=1389203 RepID=A0A9Q3BK48_9BASI|nr:hypothetical protein [Austropuccinia psidii MF-1]
MQEEAPSQRGGIKSILGASEDEEGEDSVQEEDPEVTEVTTSLGGAPEAPEAQNLALYNQSIVSQGKANFVKMMERMTQLMGQLTQGVASWDNSRVPEFKTPSMKAPDHSDGTQAPELMGLIQSCQLIFHNYQAKFFSDRKKVLYSIYFLTGRA